MLCAIASGCFPFGSDLADVIDNALDFDPEFPAYLSEQVIDLIGKDPAYRIDATNGCEECAASSKSNLLRMRAMSWRSVTHHASLLDTQCTALAGPWHSIDGVEDINLQIQIRKMM
jgi:hypothetical protein